MEIILILFVLIFFPCVKTKAPIYLTSYRALEKLESLLPTNKRFSFVDLGCGSGRVIAHLSKKFKNGSFVGVELSPVLFLYSFLRTLFKRNVKIKLKSIFLEKLEEYDYIYLFLSPVANNQLENRLFSLKNKTIISNTFKFQNASPTRVIKDDQTILIYSV